MDQSQASLVDALVDCHAANRYGFTPPGHRQGRGVDDRVREVLGRHPFRDDVLAVGMNLPDGADTSLSTFRVVAQ
jgi:arginine decarboxylase